MPWSSIIVIVNGPRRARLIPSLPGRTACSSTQLKFIPINREAKLRKLGSVEGPVIQANGRMTFRDDLRSGGLLYFTVRTELADSMVTLGDPRGG